MSFRNFIQSLRNYSSELEATREKDALRVSLDIIAQVKLRIQGAGKDYNEQPFTPYTPKYKETRAKLGYQTERVDLTRTGRLWANVRPVVIAKSLGIVTISVGAISKDNELKVRGFVKKRPNPMLPSKKELTRAQTAYFQLRQQRRLQ